MKKLRVTVEPFQGTIPFRILQRGRVLVEGSFSGKCTQLHSRTFQVNATNEELTVECTMNAAKCRMVCRTRRCRRCPEVVAERTTSSDCNPTRGGYHPA